MSVLARARSGLRAVIFDVDGTLAETERDGHLPAFNRAFADLGLPYRWTSAEYGRLLAVNGGRARLRHYLQHQGETDLDSLVETLHKAKTEHFLRWLHGPTARPRPGAAELIDQLRAAGVAVAVATCGTRAWVEPLLSRMFSGQFAAVVTGDDVQRLKPDPEAYLIALERLGVAAGGALAIEDSPSGVAAARAAGLRCLVVTSAYTRRLAFPQAAAVLPGYLAIDQFDAPERPYLQAGITADALARLLTDPLAR